ncbi:hypothetical protein [Acuticoccus kandeliae]|uniref:hypothetical protein n=1 Tax=Acuticoccus kandeliae TaxID=2073160 RepID=UPI0013005236|nr:hypothetical protein [Acuticoccus kandeliae]
MAKYNKLQFWNSLLEEILKITTPHGFDHVEVCQYSEPRKLPIGISILKPDGIFWKSIVYLLNVSEDGSIIVSPFADVKIDLSHISVDDRLINLINTQNYRGFISGSIRLRSIDNNCFFHIYAHPKQIDDNIFYLKQSIEEVALPHLSKLNDAGDILEFVRRMNLNSHLNLNERPFETALYWLTCYSLSYGTRDMDREISDITGWVRKKFGVKDRDVQKFRRLAKDFKPKILQ